MTADQISGPFVIDKSRNKPMFFQTFPEAFFRFLVDNSRIVLGILNILPIDRLHREFLEFTFGIAHIFALLPRQTGNSLGSSRNLPDSAL